MPSADLYTCFSELRSSEDEGAFSIHIQDRRSPVLVLAIHGGAIEPGTSQIAVAIAGDDFDLYLFEGRKPSRNATLHITSHCFDEPRALSLAARSDSIISVHGCADSAAITFVGGADVDLATSVARALRDAGFLATPHEDPELQGKSLSNICNRGMRNRGLQLEITRGLRDALVANADQMQRYASAIRSAGYTSLG